MSTTVALCRAIRARAGLPEPGSGVDEALTLDPPGADGVCAFRYGYDEDRCSQYDRQIRLVGRARVSPAPALLDVRVEAVGDAVVWRRPDGLA